MVSEEEHTHTEKLKQPTHDFPLSTHTRRFTGTYRKKKAKKKDSQEDGANNKTIFISSLSNQRAKPHDVTSLSIYKH
jgi:hypothetical protein